MTCKGTSLSPSALLKLTPFVIISSIQNMDVIYVMHQGRLVHQGSHEQLLAEKAELYLQLLGQNSAAI